MWNIINNIKHHIKNQIYDARYICLVKFCDILKDYNMLYMKIFQSIAYHMEFLTEKEMNYFIQFTDNVPYKKEEVDMSFLTTLHNFKMKNKEDNIEIDYINEEPIQCGTIALVYEGRLSNGKEIICKVLRKDIHKTLETSFYKFQKLIKIISELPYLKHLDLPRIIEENKIYLFSQCDFQEEVKNAKEIYNNFKNIDYIVIPKVYEIFTEQNKNIIVMEKLKGYKLNEINHKDKIIYANLLSKFSIKCILFDRLYHGDLHGGNIFFIKDNNILNDTFTYQYKLGIIDYGIIGKLTREEQNTYYYFFKYFFIDRDCKETAELILNELVENYRSISNKEQIELNMKLSLLLQEFIETNKDMNVQEIYTLNKLLSNYGLRLSKSFCKLEFALAIANTLIKKLCENTNETYVQLMMNNIDKKLFQDLM